MHDDQLLALHMRGCPDAFGLLLERYRRPCIAIAMQMLKNTAQAEDEVQTAFAKAYAAACKDLRVRASFAAWLKQVVANQCRGHLRSERRRNTESADAMVTELRNPCRSHEDLLVEAELVEVARREAGRLPITMRTVFRLVVLEGKSLKQCAEHLGIAEGNAKSRLARARKELRLRLRKCSVAAQRE
jgi:RNA polymerase sigma-70 factor (ECF subfamily)